MLLDVREEEEKEKRIRSGCVVDKIYLRWGISVSLALDVGRIDRVV